MTLSRARKTRAPACRPSPPGLSLFWSSVLRLSTPTMPLYIGLMTWIWGDSGLRPSLAGMLEEHILRMVWKALAASSWRMK